MLISVIVPVYNVKNYLKDCISSIISQSYRDIEIVIIDDGSTDGSGVICDEYAKRDNRIIVIHQKNKGLSAARNAGLDISSGDYVCFVDSDDWVENNYILNFVEKAREQCVVCCGYNIIRGNNIKAIHYQKHSTFLVNEFIECFLDNCQKCVLFGEDELVGNYAWNKLWPRESFKNVRFPEGRNYEDIYVFIELLRTVNHIEILPVSNYNYRIRENSIVNSASKKNMMDAVNSRLKQERDLSSNTSLIVKAQLLTLHNICRLFFAYYNGDYDLEQEEKNYYIRLIRKRLSSLSVYNCKKLYIKSNLILYFGDMTKYLYGIRNTIKYYNR